MSERETSVVVAEAGIGPYVQDVRASNHAFLADEPREAGGQDRGPAPYDLLLAALGACTSMTLRMYAENKKWPLEKVSVALTHKKVKGADGRPSDEIVRKVTLVGDLDAEQRARLIEIANKCPVHRTLENTPHITTEAA